MSTAQVDSIEDPILREMVRVAARDLTTYLQANRIDPATINPEAAAWFMVRAIEGPARQAAQRELLDAHGETSGADEDFGTNPAALAWARRIVQRDIDKMRRWHREDLERANMPGHPLAEPCAARAEQWRRIANHMDRTFIGGEGCVIAGFDARRPQFAALVAKGEAP